MHAENARTVSVSRQVKTILEWFSHGTNSAKFHGSKMDGLVIEQTTIVAIAA